MRRTSNKKNIDRRKRPRSSSRSTSQARDKQKNQADSRPSAGAEHKELCENCSRDLTGEDRALFVEEEVGRIFCSENCIVGYFGPDIEKLEKEYHRKRSQSDLNASEREELGHLRWLTLQEPDEVWSEKTLTGDRRYTLISEFLPGDRRVWCVCICLFLRGEPSFLYLAFPTRNEAMVNSYRKGERMEWRSENDQNHPHSQKRFDSNDEEVAKPKPMIDGLADAWTEDEMRRAKLLKDRRKDDIPLEDFNLYQSCLEETLEIPDEVWTINNKENTSPLFYHFIRHYPDESPEMWYVIIARETDNDEQIEILDAFPTRDFHLVDQYRKGTQEVGILETSSASRIVH